MDGRCAPIHPGGGWHCGSGPSGSADTYARVSVSATREWRDQDFTRPTTCPECRADVFFIRHNGGSVWVDELGWPWPKHACFDDPHGATSTFSTWSLKVSGITNPKLGVVTRLKSGVRHAELVLEIRLNDSTRLALVLRWMPSAPAMLGALVIVSREDNLLLHTSYGEIPFHSAVELPAEKNGWLKCPRCKTWVQTENFDSHERHCGKTRQQRLMVRPCQKERIASESLRIAKKAWIAAAATKDPQTRIKLARQRALCLIRLLPPPIRGAVQNLFTSTSVVSTK